MSDSAAEINTHTIGLSPVKRRHMILSPYIRTVIITIPIADTLAVSAIVIFWHSIDMETVSRRPATIGLI